MISFQRNASMKKNFILKHPVARRISHGAGIPNADERFLRVRDAEVRLRPSRGWSAAPLCPFVEMLLWTASDCSKGSACQKIRAFCQVGFWSFFTLRHDFFGPLFSNFSLRGRFAKWSFPRPRGWTPVPKFAIFKLF